MNPVRSDDSASFDEFGNRRLGRYLLRYHVANGGMASVYLGQLSSGGGFHKWVAIKVIHPHIAQEPRFVQMFMNEARLAARLDHPNICTVFDFGETDGTYYLAMEYLHGQSLAAVMQRIAEEMQPPRPVPIGLAARIIADTARGLHSAHELRSDDGRLAGVVHRDVSPQNVFVLYGGASKIVDFGIAHWDENLGERTATGELKGKLTYMSPEQIAHKEVDRRTDVWALGTVLWEVTVGRRLFKRANEALTIMAVLGDPIPRPSSVVRNYPPALEAIVMHALDRNPARRYATALELARDLENYCAQSGQPCGADEVGAFMREIFAEDIVGRDQMLRRAPAEGPVPEPARKRIDSTSDLRPAERFPQQMSPASQADTPSELPFAATVLASAKRAPSTVTAESTAGLPSVGDSTVTTPIARKPPAPTVTAAPAAAWNTPPPASVNGAWQGAPPGVAAQRLADPSVPIVGPNAPTDPLAVHPAPRRRGTRVVTILAFVALFGLVGSLIGVRFADRAGAHATPAHAGLGAADISVETTLAQNGGGAHPSTPPPARPQPAPAPIAPVPAPTPAPSTATANTPSHASTSTASRRHTHARSNEDQGPAPIADSVRQSNTPAMGTVTFNSNHPCAVYEGGRRLGTAPIAELPATVGSHSYQLVRNNQTAQTVHVTVSPGTATLVQARWPDP